MRNVGFGAGERGANADCPTAGGLRLASGQVMRAAAGGSLLPAPKKGALVALAATAAGTDFAPNQRTFPGTRAEASLRSRKIYRGSSDAVPLTRALRFTRRCAVALQDSVRLKVQEHTILEVDRRQLNKRRTERTKSPHKYSSIIRPLDCETSPIVRGRGRTSCVRLQRVASSELYSNFPQSASCVALLTSDADKRRAAFNDVPGHRADAGTGTLKLDPFQTAGVVPPITNASEV